MDNRNDNILNLINSIPKKVRLIAVSKTKPCDDILKVYNLGVRDFGENRVLELVSKIKELPKDIRWHLVGHLQTNKVAVLLKNDIYLIHSVDSLKVAQTIDKYAKNYNKTQNVLLEVNLTKEQSKSGFEIENLMADFPKILSLDNIKVLGLMCIGKKGEDSSLIFCTLKNLMQELNQKFNAKMSELSMGMSADYSQAIDEGATMVRIGSLIFGERN